MYIERLENTQETPQRNYLTDYLSKKAMPYKTWPISKSLVFGNAWLYQQIHLIYIWAFPEELLL